MMANSIADISDQLVGTAAADPQVTKTFESLPSLLRADRALVRIGKMLNVDCLLGPIGLPFLVSIRQGLITEISAASKPMPSWRFSYTASSSAWVEYWRPEPKPGWHDLLALTQKGEASLTGDLYPFMTHLQYFKDLLALPRPAISGQSA
jgi:hypothetical protein